MRILVVTNLYPPVVVGGYEVECAGVVGRLRESHEVLVLTSDLGARRVPPAPGVLRSLPFGRRARRDSLRAPLAALSAARATRGALTRFRPDLIYVWNGSRIPQVALHIASESGIPLAFRVSEHWFGDLYRHDRFLRHLVSENGKRDGGLWKAWGRLVRFVNRHPALRIDLSVECPAALSWNSHALRRLVPVPPTVRPVLEDVTHPATADAGYFSGLERQPVAEPTLVFVGRVKPEKGPDVAYRALAALRDRHGIDARLLVAGRYRSGMGRWLHGLARDLGVSERVELLGPLDRDRLGRVLQEASAIVIPSVWQEPFGLVCVEAALARVPVVASRSGGMVEALREGKEALFFPIGDSDACADALAATLADPDETQRRVARAYARARENTLSRYLDASESFVTRAQAALAPASSPPFPGELRPVEVDVSPA